MRGSAVADCARDLRTMRHGCSCSPSVSTKKSGLSTGVVGRLVSELPADHVERNLLDGGTGARQRLMALGLWVGLNADLARFS